MHKPICRLIDCCNYQVSVGVFLAGLAAAMTVFLWKIATNPGADLGGVLQNIDILSIIM